jgi:DNA-binding MarR family transcriptional regulator
MDKEPFNVFELEQARLMANLTLQMEKFCQVKENFFASKFNLTPAEFRCLRAIKDSPKVTTKELAKTMKLSPGRITHLLNSLEIKNLVFRDIDRSDRRSIQVTLTDDAVIFIDRVISEYSELHVQILRYLPKSKRIEILNNMKFFFMALKDWANER